MGIRKRVPFGKRILRKLCLGSERLLGAAGEVTSPLSREEEPSHRTRSSALRDAARWLPPHRPPSGNPWAAHNSNPGSLTDGNATHTGLEEHRNTQNTHGLGRLVPELLGSRWTPLPRSLLSSSGTTSAEHCALSRRTPGPAQPEGLFFPHWLERGAHSKEKLLMFTALNYVRNKSSY